MVIFKMMLASIVCLVVAMTTLLGVCDCTDAREGLIAYVEGPTIHVYHTLSQDTTTFTAPSESITDIVFGAEATLYWTDDMNKSVFAVTSQSDVTAGDIYTVIDTGLKSAHGIAVDWVTGNLYITDTTAGEIIVCSNKGDNCAVVLKNLNKPREIVIGPDCRSLLWTQYGEDGTQGTIFSANMDGTEINPLFEHLRHPSNLVVDVTSNALYWSEETNTMHILYMAKFEKPTTKVEVRRLNKTDVGQDINMVNTLLAQSDEQHNITVMDGQLSHSAVYKPNMYPGPDKGNNKCDVSPCSHICVPSDVRTVHVGYTCLCPVYMTLSAMGADCEDTNSDKLLVAGLPGIYEVPLEYTGLNAHRAKLLYKGDVDVISYEPYSRQLVFHDYGAQSLKIMPDMRKPSEVQTLYAGLPIVEGIAIDVTSGVLYWTTMSVTPKDSHVYVGKLDGSMSMSLVSGLDKPRGITLDIASGFMYICDWGDHARIIRCQMDGSECYTFSTVAQGHPNMIVMETKTRTADVTTNVIGDLTHEKTLYWTDSKLDRISYISLDDPNMEGEIRLNHSNPHPFALALTDSRIYYTDLNSGTTGHLHYIDRTHTPVVTSINLGLSPWYGLQYMNRHLDSVTPPVTKCSTDNGGCSHMCLGKPATSRTCLCPENLVLATDSATCSVLGQIRTSPTASSVDTGNKTSTGSNTRKAKTKSSTGSPNYSTPSLETKLPTWNQAKRRHVKDDSSLLVVVLVAGFSCLLVVVTVAGCFWYHKKHQWKRSLINRMVRYVKTPTSDDSRKLVTRSNCDCVDVKHFDESIDSRTSRDMSTVSMDSAFTEMREFDF